MTWFLWLWLLAALSPAGAERLDWSFPLAAGHVAIIEIEDEQGQQLTRFLTADGAQGSQFGWRPDLDPRQGRVRGELAELWLTPGHYRVLEHVPGHDREYALDAISSSPRLVMVILPEQATGVAARRQGGPGTDQHQSGDQRPQDRENGFAWAPVSPGNLALLSLAEGTWRAWATGPLRSDEQRIEPGQSFASLVVVGPAAERLPDGSRQRLVRWGLLPPALLLALLVGLVLRRERARLPSARQLAGVGLFCLALGAVAVSAVLGDPNGAILLEGEGFTDPLDSIAQLGCMAHALPRLSDLCPDYSWPEGSTWLVTGPSWLGYLLPSALTWLAGPVVGHNLGVCLAVALLGFTCWALARSLGAGPTCSLLAAGGAALAPVLLDELDTMSLDRSSLFLVPLFFLALHRADRESGWGWPVAAGAALAAVFYGQVHYGLYLAAACPLLVLPRLLVRHPWRRLQRFAVVAVVALLLLAPGLYVLQAGTEGTPYQGDQTRLIHSGVDLLHPVRLEDAQAFLEAYDPRQGGGKDPPMGSAQDRLLSATARSITLRDLITPGEYFPARSWYWPAVALCLLLVAARRRAVLASLDVLILLIFALGPMLRLGDQEAALLLPYYLDFLLIPGFEQLKQVNRFLLLAASIAPVPLALGLHGLVERLRTRWPALRAGWLWGPGLLGICLLLGWLLAVRAAGLNFRQWPPAPYYAEGGEDSLVALRFALPRAEPWPPAAVLQRLEPGPALALPLAEPTHALVSIQAAQAGMSLVNSPPFGMPGRLTNSFWFETNAFLNQLAWASGSDRPRRQLGSAGLDQDVAALRGTGLRYVMLYRDLLPGPELVPATEELLDSWLLRVADDGELAVWELPAAGGS